RRAHNCHSRSNLALTGEHRSNDTLRNECKSELGLRGSKAVRNKMNSNWAAWVILHLTDNDSVIFCHNNCRGVAKDRRHNMTASSQQIATKNSNQGADLAARRMNRVHNSCRKV